MNRQPEDDSLGRDLFLLTTAREVEGFLDELEIRLEQKKGESE